MLYLQFSLLFKWRCKSKQSKSVRIYDVHIAIKFSMYFKNGADNHIPPQLPTLNKANKKSRYIKKFVNQLTIKITSKRILLLRFN